MDASAFGQLNTKHKLGVDEKRRKACATDGQSIHRQTRSMSFSCLPTLFRRSRRAPSSWEEEDLEQNEISEIHVRSGALIDKIEFRYRDGTRAVHGKNGGDARPPFILQQGEKLVRIETKQGLPPWKNGSPALIGCQFYTNFGRASEWFGGPRGGPEEHFKGSAERPIIDIKRDQHGFCPRIRMVVDTEGCDLKKEEVLKKKKEVLKDLKSHVYHHAVSDALTEEGLHDILADAVADEIIPIRKPKNKAGWIIRMVLLGF